MGLHLNPSKRQPAAKFGKKKSKSVNKTRKTVPKTLKTKAKKYGVKLTVKRGDKRVAKTEKVLRRQLANKMKAKKVPKRKVAKRKAPKRKVTKRKVAKRKRKVSKFGATNKFFF
jgi:adenylate kinase